jgi:hypothetical protein
MDKGEHDSQGDIINIEAYFIAHKYIIMKQIEP